MVCRSLLRATVLLAHRWELLYHPDSTRNTTVPVPRLSVLSIPTILPKMKMVGQPSLANKRSMDPPRAWIRQKITKDNKRIHGWNESTVGFIGCSKNLHDWKRGKLYTLFYANENGKKTLMRSEDNINKKLTILKSTILVLLLYFTVYSNYYTRYRKGTCNYLTGCPLPFKSREFCNNCSSLL